MKKGKKLVSRWVLAILLAEAGGVSVFLHAQDIHFSQFYMPNLWLNPAMTGFTPYPFRLVLGYRNQWQSVTPYPYRTFYGSVDLPIFTQAIAPNILGVGVMIIDDRAGHSRLGTTEILGSVAYHWAIGGSPTEPAGFIGLGLQGGWGQRSFKTDLLTFGDQFGLEGFDPNRPTQEAFPSLSSSFVDLNAGFWSFFNLGANVSLYFGGSVYHINNPSIQFMNEIRPLYRRYLGYVGTVVNLNVNNALVITGVSLLQHQYREFDLGIGWIYYPTPSAWTSGYRGRGDKSIMFGLWYRWMDAIYPGIRYDSRYFSAGITYDINISSLRRASEFRGGIEVFIAIYGIKLPKKEQYKRIYCPKFGS